MPPLRVMVVLHGAPPDAMGGAGLIAGGLAHALMGLGHKAFLAHSGPATDAQSWRGVPLLCLGGRAARGFTGSWKGDEAAALRLLETVRPDVVHIHHLSGWPLALPRLARAAGARVVLTLHDYAIPCARGQLVDVDGALCSGPATRRCADCLAPFLGIQARLTGAPSSRSRRSVSHRLSAASHALRDAHTRLAPSSDLAARIQRMGGGEVRVHPLPLPRPIRPAPHAASGPIRFLFCSSLIPTKGPHRLLAAFSRLPSGTAQLTLAGPGTAFPAAPTFAADLAAHAATVPGVHLPGSVPHSGVEALLHAHDVLVVPSLWPENSPLIVREATAAGLRTILPLHGGSRELDPTGRLVDATGRAGEDRLLAALVAECHDGRGRRSPRVWPTPLDHARSLVAGPYARESDARWQRTD